MGNDHWEPDSSKSKAEGSLLVGLEVGRYLKDRRESLRLTQQELADRSALLSSGFDRSYVARQEAGSLSGSVERFLTYLSLLRADVDTVSELLSLGERIPQGGEHYESSAMLERAKQLSGQGLHDEALTWALGVIRRGIEHASAEEQARGMVAASIVLKHQGAWEMARRFAERAFNLPGLSPSLQGRAALQLSECNLCQGELASARAYLGTIEKEQFDTDCHLAALYWQQLGIILRIEGDHQQALEAFEQAATQYRRNASPSDEARSLAVQARCSLSLGKKRDALSLARAALKLSEQANNEATTMRVLIDAGVVFAACDLPQRGRELLVAAEQRARRLGHATFLFEARLWLYDAARRLNDGPLLGFLARRLKADRQAITLDPEEAHAFQLFFGDDDNEEESQ